MPWAPLAARLHSGSSWPWHWSRSPSSTYSPPRPRDDRWKRSAPTGTTADAGPRRPAPRPSGNRRQRSASAQARRIYALYSRHWGLAQLPSPYKTHSEANSWHRDDEVYDHVGFPRSFARRFVRRCRTSYEVILVKILHGIAPSGASTWDGFGPSGSAFLTPQTLSARVLHRACGPRGRADHEEARGRTRTRSTTAFGFSTCLIPGAFAPREAHYCAGYVLKPLKSLVASTAVVQAR